jgi:hypothetical protein
MVERKLLCGHRIKGAICLIHDPQELGDDLIDPEQICSEKGREIDILKDTGRKIWGDGNDDDMPHLAIILEIFHRMYQWPFHLHPWKKVKDARPYCFLHLRTNASL